jgi:hypothetical protein
MKQELTHDDIVFRVLLQREDVRPTLTFAALEEVVPKSIRKSIESDWRSYIRTEGLEFDNAFQKAIRKHIPGLHFIVLAAEFLGKTPFHIALGHFLQPDKFKWTSATSSEEEVFKLADRLEDEFRLKRANLLRHHQKVYAPPAFTPKPAVPTRKCYFCRKLIPVAELYQHIDSVHLNPAHLGGATSRETILPTPADETTQIPVTPNPPVAVVISPPVEFSRFKLPRCACGSIAIPGDFYCYHCAPD